MATGVGGWDEGASSRGLLTRRQATLRWQGPLAFEGVGVHSDPFESSPFVDAVINALGCANN